MISVRPLSWLAVRDWFLQNFESKLWDNFFICYAFQSLKGQKLFIKLLLVWTLCLGHSVNCAILHLLLVKKKKSFCLCQQDIKTCDEKVIAFCFDNVSLSIQSRGSSNQDLAARPSIGSSGTTTSTTVPSSTTTATAGVSSWELS